jgi:hypothetical protein
MPPNPSSDDNFRESAKSMIFRRIELKESSLVVMNSLNDEPYLRRSEGLAIATNAATALAKCRLELQNYVASPIH